MFIDVILFDLPYQGSCSVACCLMIIQVFTDADLVSKLQALLPLLAFLSIHQALCLLLQCTNLWVDSICHD